MNITGHEPLVRIATFLAVFGLLAVSEVVVPRRRRTFGRWTRWPSNLAVPAVNTALVRMFLPTTAVGVAVLVEERGWGLLHAVTPLPPWLAVGLGVLVLDFAIYFQRILFHAVPVLWRLHRCTMRTSTLMSPPGRAFTRSRSCSRWASSSG